MPRSFVTALAALASPALLLWFAGAGLAAGFTHDDLMNIYGAYAGTPGEYLGDIAAFFRPARTFRPVGSLFYLFLFESFGLTPLPYRIACYLLLLANLGLAWALLRRLTDSAAAAAVGTLLHAYHPGFGGLYTNTGMCYDLLCFFFFGAAFLYYLRAREGGLPLGARQVAVWSLLYILCLNSKEMAVSLPVVILAYELLRGAPRRGELRTWILGPGRVALTGTLITILFLAGRVLNPQGLPAIGPYRPDVRPVVYWRHARHFLQQGLYDPGWLGAGIAAAFLVLIVLAALAWRSPAYRLGLVWMAVGILPVAFIQQRGLDAVYIPTLGAALCLAVAVEALTRRLPQPAVVAGLLFLLIVVHARYGCIDFDGHAAPARHIAAILEQVRHLHFPREARILFLRDPFPNDNWSSCFAVLLTARDRTLMIRRADSLPGLMPRGETFDPHAVLSYENGRLLECRAAPLQGAATAGLAAAPCTPPESRAWYATP